MTREDFTDCEMSSSCPSRSDEEGGRPQTHLNAQVEVLEVDLQVKGSQQQKDTSQQVYY